MITKVVLSILPSLWRDIPLVIALLRYRIFFFFKQIGRFATLHQASLSALFFQKHLLTPGLCHILLIPTVFQTSSLLLHMS